MARPIKQGLDYFPLDVGFFEDIKIRRIKKDCGNQSIPILIAILCSIYREEGYYVGFNSDLTFLIAEMFGVSEGAVEDTARKAVEVEFFDSHMFHNYQILTSSGIQRRFFEATSKRKEVRYNAIFMLISINDYNNLVNVCNNSINVYDNEQSKVKESKVKESKVKESKVKEILCSAGSYQSIVDGWNSLNLQQVVGVNSGTTRAKLLNARLKEYGEERILQAINNINYSDFLKGQNNRGWIISFDWFIKPNNFLKVLEGNYNNRTDRLNNTNSAIAGFLEGENDECNENTVYLPSWSD